MAQLLRASCAFPEDSVSIPSTHMAALRPVYDSSSRRSDALTQTYAGKTPVHIKINKFLKRKM